MAEAEAEMALLAGVFEVKAVAVASVEVAALTFSKAVVAVSSEAVVAAADG